jgi:heme oxygenase (biliverdin-producing, ferredoxin)
MSNLKDLLKEQHTNAERQEFVKVLMSGKIHPDFYATYLWNQHKKYDLLEALACLAGIFTDIGDIRQKMKIEEDFKELWHHDHAPILVPSTYEYINHMKSIMTDGDKLMAHVYVLHMGDLSGGQMIARKVPGEGRMYKFDGDIAAIKEKIRAKTTDAMAPEAAYVFESSTRLFKELMEIECERYLESPDTVSE